jgi:multiple sugar transport system ATP-binding protein
MDEPLSNLDAKLRIQMRAEILRIQRSLHSTTVYVTHDQTEAMTLGDRLAVMRDGVLQQVGSPDDLYNRPRNVFVAGFIGAPSMNFLAGEIARGELRFALATIPLSELAGSGATVPADREGKVVIGIRPEDFEDVALTSERAHGVGVRAMIDVLESTGSDVYAHLTLNGQNGELGEPLTQALAAAGDVATEEVAPAAADVIARLGASSRIAEGSTGDLWLDTSRLHLFDPDSGARLE